MMVTMKASHERIKAPMDVSLEKTETCLEKMEATDLEANPEETESEVEHKEVPKDDAAVETDKALNKRHGDQNLVAGCGKKPQERTQGKGGCQKQLAAARRGMIFHAGVAGHKGHCSQGNSREKCCTRNPKQTNRQEETVKGPRMQKWNKEPGPETAATSRKQEGIQQDRQADFQTGHHEMSSQDFQWVAKNK
jgi:hypothetical protein